MWFFHNSLLYPLFLPILHFVTIITLPATALYALAGILSSPLMIPLLIGKNVVTLAMLTPFYLMALPLAIPIGFVAAVICLVMEVIKCVICLGTMWFLWPVYLFLKFTRFTCCIAEVMVTDTIHPWFVPPRFVTLTALMPKLALGI